MYDLIIIGAGPAGISAGVYAVSRGMKTLVLEKAKVGGLIGNVSTVTHYAGIIEGETGDSFARRLEAQALLAGVEIRYEEVKKVELLSEIKVITTEAGSYEAKQVILANGTSPRMLNIAGEKELGGKGMRMNAAKHGADYRGKHVYVVGGADGAVKEAIYLAKFAKKVTIIHFEETLGCIAEFRNKIQELSNIELKLSSRLHAVYGNDKVESLEIANVKTEEIEKIEDEGCGIFVYAGTVPNTELYSQLDMEDGYVCTDEQMRTSASGVYAIGDIRLKAIRQVSTAVCDGTLAAIAAAAK